MIKLVCFDFDGVFTNGHVFFDKDNNIIKQYDVKDGQAIRLLSNKKIYIGLISSFSRKDYKLEEINDNTNDDNTNDDNTNDDNTNDNNTDDNNTNDDKDQIINLSRHLNFDFVSIGKGNKLDIIKEWINKLSITFENVAYIGDDLPDIPILEAAKLSACPADAVEECKDISDYICVNKGGEGCVREFCEYILSKNSKINHCNMVKKEALHQLNNFPIEDITKLSIFLKDHPGNIFLTGIGKSENIAHHCATLLKCIGIKAFYLDCTNSLHGDIGPVTSDDIVMLFSKSGNTEELIKLLLHLKNRKCYTIGICCSENSKFHDICNRTISLPLNNEIEGVITTIPTNSYMAQLFFSNFLVTYLSKEIDIRVIEYKENHPAGNIGSKLKCIKDILIKNFPKIILEKSIALKNILLEMTNYSMGCCFFINRENKLLGLLTDGDIRRILLKEPSIEYLTKKMINTTFHFENDMSKLVMNIINSQKSKFIPILDRNKKILGIIDFRDINESEELIKYNNRYDPLMKLYKPIWQKLATIPHSYISEDIDEYFKMIEKKISNNIKKWMDIACGYGLLNVPIYRKLKGGDIFLIDKSYIGEGRKDNYGTVDSFAFYADMTKTKELLLLNNVNIEHLHFYTPLELKHIPELDMVISRYGWGFHFPYKTYSDIAHTKLKRSGILIIDVRKKFIKEVLKDKRYIWEVLYTDNKLMCLCGTKK